MMDTHIKLKIKGTVENLSRFHAMAKYIDDEWPFVTSDSEGRDKKIRQCEHCGGLLYPRPLMSAHDIITLGKQAGLRSVRIKRYERASVCTRQPSTNTDTTLSETEVEGAVG